MPVAEPEGTGLVRFGSLNKLQLGLLWRLKEPARAQLVLTLGSVQLVCRSPCLFSGA